MTEAVYIAGYVRSPFTFARKGALAGVRPDDLGAHVVRSLLARTGVPADEIEDVVWGCAFPEAEQGLNIGRVVGLLGGLPVTSAGATVNRWCGSSVQAVQVAVGMLMMGAGEAIIAGGTECMSRVPMMGFNLMPHPSWSREEVDDFVNVGLTAERVAREHNVTRADQDLFARASHQKALAAQADGRLAAEIAPYQTAEGLVSDDGCIRDTPLEKMAELKTAFLKDGTVTAASSSPMTDGSTAVLVCTETFLKRHGLTPLATVKGFAVSGCEPGVMGLGPIESSRKAIKRAGLKVDAIDIIEMNEAFAAQAEACRRALGIDPARLNIDGGAIALGHPLGATGTRLVGKAATLLQREGKKYALATQCIGGGMGIAMVLEAA
ncbi:acetyl-CoA C-acyltransferase [Frigidibacter albus]|uniref:Acetyl-CoA C-acyltransferase n=1 Tax=Frigidibacter albus TaxID=1465486 RepID=A0A6L8VLK5_9RHOB|nr:thiolase family protein [Frigidibacter albus]MZQ91093.1 acetyl-CoA C-acyltransferase [Frigidibacter albus]NBE32978.1 acetyl-CoA C-acyltransferase [Frigidibacter albus]GGH62752.1 acetyl-CoA acetyltransferase [Frigidibacter albus]